MKIKPWDGYVIKKFYEIFAKIAALFSIWVAFFPISDETRKISGILFLVVCAAIYAGVLVFANLTQKVELKIRNTKIVIRVGDIWEASGKKVIPMNEYYDTENLGIISERSLHGQFIERYKDKEKELYDHIVQTLNSRSIKGVVQKRSKGKNIRYDLGTICEYEGFLLLAYTSFDKDNMANLYGDKCPRCYANMWHEIDIHNNGESISMPVLGTGKTRFDKDYKPQELLEMLLFTFRMSGVNLERQATLNIIVHETMAKDINFLRLKNFSDRG